MAVSGVTLPGAPAPQQTVIPALTGGVTPTTSQLALGGSPSVSYPSSFNPGISAINPSGGVVPAGIPNQNLKPTTQPTSAITSKPLTYGAYAAPGSVVDYLGSKGQASDFNTRLNLAASLGINGYTGTAAQNAQLLGLLKSGSSTPAPQPTMTATGSMVAANNDGTIASPSGFKVDTSNISSDALNSNHTTGDVHAQAKTYLDYVNGLAASQQYSPEYINALESYNHSKLQEAQLNSNLYTGKDLPGDTMPYAQGSTARALALNQLSQLSAGQQMQVQQLVRQGNIAAATALVQASQPQGVSPGSSLVSPLTGDVAYGGAGAYSDYQAQQTYFNLAQNFPDAQIPAYDPSKSAQQNLQAAQQLASQAPSFQSRNLMMITDAAGGIHLVNKNQVQTDAHGNYTFVSSGDAATQAAAKAAITQLTTQKASTQAALSAAESNFPLLIAAATKAGVGQNTPLFVNNIKQQAATQLGNADYASYSTLAASLQSEYSRIIARGGTVDDSTRNSAKAILDGTYNLGQLESVYNTVKREGANLVGGFDSAIAEQQAAINSATVGGSTGGGSSSGSGYITPSQAAAVSW